MIIIFILFGIVILSARLEETEIDNLKKLSEEYYLKTLPVIIGYTKGFDGEEFMNFLVKLKGENANNLEQWTLDELKMVKHKINKYSL